LVSKAASDARMAKSARIIYELAFLKLTKPEIDRTQEGILDKLGEMERKLSGGLNYLQPSPATGVNNNDEIIKRLEAVENAVKNGIVPEKKQEQPEETEKKVSSRLYVPIPEEELTYEYPTAELARNWNKTFATMLNQGNVYAVPLKNCVVTFDAEGIILLVPEGRDIFTKQIFSNHIDDIRESFRRATGSNYTIKVAKRSDFDERNIIDAFSLPHSKDGLPNPSENTVTANKQENTVETADKLDSFIEKFSGIIVDADRIPADFDREKAVGEQSSIDDIEEENEKEEFLEESEKEEFFNEDESESS
jgi:hypothetical protein